MVQVAMLVAGVATGLRSSTFQRARLVIAIVFAAVLVVQTPLVAMDDGLESGADFATYTAIQLVSIVVALVIARVLVNRRTS